MGLTDTTVLYDAEQPEDLRYLLGLLNSKLLTFRFRTIGKLKSGGILEYFWNRASPSCRFGGINLSKAADKAKHDQVVKLVDQMHTFVKQHASARTGDERTSIERQLEATDRNIDRHCHDLYRVTAEGIALVEEEEGRTLVADDESARGRGGLSGA